MADKIKTPRTKELEFGGFLGALALLFVLPGTVLYLLLTCSTQDASVFSVFSLPGPLPSLQSLWNPFAVVILLGWVSLQTLLYMLPMGKDFLLLRKSGDPWPFWSFCSLFTTISTHQSIAEMTETNINATAYILRVVEGITLRDNTRLKYKINAFQAFLVTAIVAGVAVVLRVPLSYMYDHYLQFAVASALLSLALSIFLYIKSLAAPESALAPGGNSVSFSFNAVFNPTYRKW